MNNPIETIGIIKESRPDENRTPLVPEHIEKLKEKYPNLNILIQMDGVKILMMLNCKKQKNFIMKQIGSTHGIS